MTSDMKNLRLVKRQLRKTIQSNLKQLSDENITKQSSKVHELLLYSKEYQNATNISVFLSMPAGEISTAPIVKDALSKGKKVFVPFTYKDKFSNERSVMDMVALQSESDFNSFTRDKWGIPTPDKSSLAQRARCLCPNFEAALMGELVDSEEAPLEPLDLIVVPGVAFDRDLRRLGHGMGYYDNFFSDYRQKMMNKDRGEGKMPQLVAIALNEQILSDGQVPTDDSDWRVDAVITEAGSMP